MRVVTERRDLELLVALDQEGTLHACARRLHLTASALSQQLRDLERRLGGPLFARQWRKLIPNATGRHCIAGAHRVLAELARLESEARQLLAGANGTIRLAAVCQQSYRWLPALLVRYRAHHPDIDVRLVDAPADDLAGALVRHDLDVAIVAGPPPRDPRIAARPLFRDELVAIVGDGHPWWRRSRVDVEAFAGVHLVTDAGALGRTAPLGRALAAAGVSPQQTTHVPVAGTAALDFARAGWGTAVLPRWTVAPLLATGELHAVRVGRAGLWLDWAVVCRAEPLDAPVEALVTAITETRAAAPARAGRRSAMMA